MMTPAKTGRLQDEKLLQNHRKNQKDVVGFTEDNKNGQMQQNSQQTQSVYPCILALKVWNLGRHAAVDHRVFCHVG